MAETVAAQHVEEKKEEKAVTIPKAPLAFMPSSWDDAYRIAKYMAQSDLTPDALRKKEYDLLYIVATGQEFCLSPVVAVREIAIIKGKPYLSAQLRVGMVKQSPLCEFFRLIESDDKKAVFETKRKSEGLTKLTFTIEEARRAGLVGRVDRDGKPITDDNWSKYPALMLRRRCASQLADEVYPDVTRGSRDREELDEEREREVNPVPLRVVGPMMAPPPPAEAEVVDAKASPPKKERKGMKIDDVPSELPTDLSLYEKTAAVLMECDTVDLVDRLMLNVDQTKLSATEREALAKLFKDRRLALGKK